MTSGTNHRITRRRLAQGALALPIAGPAILNASRLPVAIAGEEAGGVPLYRGNASRTGVMPGPGPDSTHGVEPLWTFSVDGASFDGSSPAVDDGVVYIGSDANFYALDAATGEERWQSVTNPGFPSSPAVINGVVYIGGSDGNAYALDARTGEERWRFTTGKWGVFSPAVVDGVVYIGANDANVYGLNAETGEEQWRFATGGISWPTSPAVVDGVVYIGGNNDPNLYALDAGTGEERWRFVTKSPTTPAVVDGVVYIGGSDQNVYALNADTGEEQWRFSDASSPFSCTPAVTDGVVYIGGGDYRTGWGNTVFALSADIGEERWRFSPNLESAGRVAETTYADGVVYFGFFGGFGSDVSGVYALRAETGEVLWWFPTDGVVVTSVVVVDGVAYAGSSWGVYAIAARALRLEPGATARVTSDTALRGGPSPSAVERETLDEGTMVTVTGESTASGAGIWWPVAVIDGGREGWVIADDLEPTWLEG